MLRSNMNRVCINKKVLERENNQAGDPNDLIQLEEQLKVLKDKK